jgi:aromatic-L-amino-acid decarboxylase
MSIENMKHQSFEMDSNSIEELGAKMVKAFAMQWENSSEGLFAKGKVTDFDSIIGKSAPEQGASIQEVSEKVIHQVLPNLFNALQPNVYQLMSSPLPAVSILEFLSIWNNCQPYHAFNAQVQKAVLRWLGELIGFDKEAAGIFTKGGTASNLYALSIARVYKLGKNVRKTGLGGAAKLTAYVSEEGHSSIYKAMELLGIGSDQLRQIPFEENFKIDLRQLEKAIVEDKKNGLTPFCIIANGGSARTGAVDPIRKMAEIAKHHELWLHVDGAYGVLASMTPVARFLFNGLEEADSVSMDPHKWMNVPYESSCLLVKDWSYLYDTFEYVPDYLGSLQPEERKSFSCHFDFTQSDKALKVWYALQLYGASGYRSLIEKHLTLTKELAHKLNQISSIEIYNQPELSICCFRYVPEDLRSEKSKYAFYINNLNRSIELTLKEKMDTLIATTMIRKDLVLRVCIVSYRIQSEMIDSLVEKICALGETLDGKMRKGKNESSTISF